MTFSIWHNDNDPAAVKWLHHAMNREFIPEGHIDSRSIADINADEIRYFIQAHFFAGIGGWPLSLRMAGWHPDRPVWTASLPCQPFSTAGRRRGKDDERHLWPVFRDLVGECRPSVILGEQVASKDGKQWFCDVQNDLHSLGYVAAATDLCAACVGAPHIRQRLYWVAYRDRELRPADFRKVEQRQSDGRRIEGIQHPDGQRSQSWSEATETPRHGSSLEPASERLVNRKSRDASLPSGQAECGPTQRETGSRNGRMEYPVIQRLEGHARDEPTGTGWPPADGPVATPGFWDDCEWFPFAGQSGKVIFRPVKPGVSPLVDGIPNPVHAIRGYGNAIVPPLAAQFILTVMEWLDEC